MSRRSTAFWGGILILHVAGCAGSAKLQRVSQAQPVLLFDYVEPGVALDEIAPREALATRSYASDFEEAVVRDWLFDREGDGFYQRDNVRRRRTIVRVGRWHR